MKFKNVIIMKYGVHAQEDVHDIIVRKQEEYKKTGMMFWGYNGVLCNPLTQVQPFLEENRKKGEETYLLLVRTLSEHNGMGYLGTEFSYDKSTWMKIPDAIKVLGSKYAIVCEDLTECDVQINLHEYDVAIGESAHKPLNEYMRGRVDKACAHLGERKNIGIDKYVHVSYYSKISNAVYIK